MTEKQYQKELLAAGILSQPIKEGLIKLNLEKNWLTVEYQNNKSGDGKDFNYKLLCAQNISTMTTKELEERIVLMLAETLRSVNQDLNILTSEK